MSNDTNMDNRILAEFEGFESYEFGEFKLVFYKGIPGYGECDLQDIDLLYSSSYNWLHRVWEKFRELRFDDYIDSYRILGFSLSNIRYSDVNYTATFVDCENPYATEAQYEKGKTKN